MKKIVLFFLLGTVVLAGCQTTSSNNLYSVESISHAHGFAVDVSDSNKLYIATHYGLYTLINEKDLYQIGKKKDDYMGFSVHPTNPNIFFSSGHPSGGGNLGVQKSEDAGITWQKISNGADGPVDFHSMAVSSANPDIMYGYYAGALQRSMNGGKDWEVLVKEFPTVVNFATDPSNENVVFASTGQSGLLRSNDKGTNWTVVSEELKDTTVTALTIDPQGTQNMLSFSQKLGFAKSKDAGKTWEKINENFSNDILFFVAFDKNTAGKVYAITKNNFLYKSSNGGNSWSKIR